MHSADRSGAAGVGVRACMHTCMPARTHARTCVREGALSDARPVCTRGLRICACVFGCVRACARALRLWQRRRSCSLRVTGGLLPFSAPAETPAIQPSAFSWVNDCPASHLPHANAYAPARAGLAVQRKGNKQERRGDREWAAGRMFRWRSGQCVWTRGINMVCTFRLTMMILRARARALPSSLSLFPPPSSLVSLPLAGSLSVYHIAEFATVARYNPDIVNIDSFLVNQVCARMWCALRAACTCHSLPSPSLSATVHTAHRRL